MDTEYIGAGKKGDCYQNVQDYIVNHDDPSLVVIHGQVTNREQKTFPHAWLENDEFVIDPTTGIKTTKEKYYNILKAKPESKYNQLDAIKLRFKTNNYGPWTDEEKSNIMEKETKELDPKQLKVGTEVETEHTDDKKEAKKIATDHVKEKDDYYTKLYKAGLIDEPEAKKLAKKYLVNERQLHLIGENIIKENPEEYTVGDTVELLEPIDGYDVPAGMKGKVVHVDAIGTVRTEFLVREGVPIIIPINPEVDNIRKIEKQPLLKEGYILNKNDNSWAIFKISNGEKGFVIEMMSHDKKSIHKIDYGTKYSDPNVLKFNFNEAIAIIQNVIGVEDKYGIVNKDGIQKLYDWRIKFPDNYPNNFPELK